MKLTAAQIKAIKDSPKGKLPAFIGVGVGKGPEIVSLGGHIGKFGASVGISKGKPFATVNVKGKRVAGLGKKEGRFYGQ